MPVALPSGVQKLRFSRLLKIFSGVLTLKGTQGVAAYCLCWILVFATVSWNLSVQCFSLARSGTSCGPNSYINIRLIDKVEGELRSSKTGLRSSLIVY